MAHNLLGQSLALRFIPNGFTQDQTRKNLVPPHGIRHCTDPRARNRRMLLQGAFDFDSRNIFSRTTNDIFAPIDKINIPIRITPDDIAGMEIIAFPRFFRCLRIFQIGFEKSFTRIRSFISARLMSAIWRPCQSERSTSIFR